VFENRILRKLFGPKEEEVKEYAIKLRKGKLHDQILLG
jgi:hypothetical protein